MLFELFLTAFINVDVDPNNNHSSLLWASVEAKFIADFSIHTVAFLLYLNRAMNTIVNALEIIHRDIKD